MGPMVLDRIFRDPDTGKLAIFQRPNVPLVIFAAAAVTRAAFHPAGRAGAVLSTTATVALASWSVAEIGWGDSVFRRLLGTAVLVGLIASRVWG
jgi:hypothetical protein